MSRFQPSPRRECVTREVVWSTETAEHRFHVSVGFEHGDDRIVEVFYAAGMKEGADLRAMAQDACILISQLLQRGALPHEIGKSLSSTIVFGNAKPASIVGAIVEAIKL